MRQYIDGLLQIIKKGRKKSDRTGVGTISLFGDLQHTYYLDDGFPNLGLKYTWFKGIKYELMWFLNCIPEYYKQFGNTNIKYLVDNNINIWNEWPFENYKKSRNYQGEDINQFVEKIKNDEDFAFKYGELGPVYGSQWRGWDDVHDQIENAIATLRENPDDRGNIVSAWNVSKLEEMSLRPCHSFFQLYSEEITKKERYKLFIRKMTELGLESWKFKPMKDVPEEEMDKFEIPKRNLSLKMYQRSCDSIIGQSFNISSYALLLHIIAQATNHHPYKFIHTIGDAHIYLNHIDQTNQLLSRTNGKDSPVLDFVGNPDKIDEWIGNDMGPKLPQIYLNPKIKNINNFSVEDIKLQNYQHYGKIKAPVAV